MINEKDTAFLSRFLETPRKISIVPHRNPDGDALGASLGLYQVLKQMNHEVFVISPNDFPDFIAWLPMAEQAMIFEKNIEECTKILKQSEMVFTLDFNALQRSGEQMENVLNKLTCDFVMIDHHQMPDTYAKIMVSDTAFGSTCELLYRFLEYLQFKNYINKDVATCIYTGIVTDSGSFKFTKTTGDTHRVVAELIDLGIDNPGIHNRLFNNISYQRLQLLGRALQNLKVLPNHRTAYIFLSQKDLFEFDFQKGDTEGVVNYGLSIKGIDLAVIFIENKDEGIIKISFRSEGTFDVNNFARSYFNGGGHINAAGGMSFDTLEATIERFERVLKQINKA